jgi:SAM-dependent methyltransferase
MIKQFKGLLFPDEYIIKFFFKKKLHKIQNNVLELGCSNGNNLSLFYNFGWNVTGVDIDAKNVIKAKHNFSIIKKKLAAKNNYFFVKNDMLDFIKDQKEIKFNTIIFANSLYYLPYEKINELLYSLKSKIKNKVNIFFRIRLRGDERVKIAKKISKFTHFIKLNTTNEMNCFNTFFSKKEFLDLISKIFTIKLKTSLEIKYENLINNKIFINNDLIFWCVIR